MRSSTKIGVMTNALPADASVTLLTPPGRGALAVVGVAGREACRLAEACFHPRGPRSLTEREDASICFGRWVSDPESPGEDLVVVKHSATRLEVHCHGGYAAAEAVIASLERLGALRQVWPEWLTRSGLDPIEVEAYEAMSRVAGFRAAQILGRQASGLLQAELARLQSLPRSERGQAVDRLLAASRVGLRLTDPWRVVLAGPVNTGKSSLANALAGYSRSIVSPVPGTTRDVVTIRLVLGGFDVDLFDTAGLRASDAVASTTERAGIARAEATARSADLVLRVMPANGAFPTMLEPGPHEIVVVTKADLAPAGFASPPGSILTSTVTGLGITELVDAIVARLVPELISDPTLLDGTVPFTERQVKLIQSFDE
jgi:tRNA modification GTPase